MVYMFTGIKLKESDFKFRMLMTDDDSFRFEAFNQVFGLDDLHFLCKWHVLRAWDIDKIFF